MEVSNTTLMPEALTNEPVKFKKKNKLIFEAK